MRLRNNELNRVNLRSLVKISVYPSSTNHVMIDNILDIILWKFAKF